MCALELMCAVQACCRRVPDGRYLRASALSVRFREHLTSHSASSESVVIIDCRSLLGGFHRDGGAHRGGLPADAVRFGVGEVFGGVL